MPKKYKIKTFSLMVRDEAGTKFHVAHDDYFGTIATVLSLLKQQFKKNGDKQYTILEKTFSNLEKDLLFLQKNYSINLKPEKLKPKKLEIKKLKINKLKH